MAARLFSFDLRDDGSARFLLNFKRVDGSGIQRISCDLDPVARLEIVLFAEALALRQSLGARVAAEVEAGGLMLAYEPGQPDLRVERQAGYSR
ncbi:hypothetical protein HCZ87_19765, partial [Phaeobacter sp. HF9A]|nr:hypothetical protein [Phaeobacter sp. HF9A]